ncbi:hypothetical protein ACS0TY_004883 [Phlomoides rotata]
MPTMKLPLIDFSDLKQETPTWESVKTQVLEALQEYGCFEAKFDEIPLHLRKSVFGGMQQLFDLPLHTKTRNMSDNPYDGYYGKSSIDPLYESFGIEDSSSPGKIDAFTDLMWPQGNPTFSKSVESFAEQLIELDKTVRRLLLESLGLKKYEDEHMDSTQYVVKFNKYDGPGSCETKLGLTSHTDNNIVTILYQNEVSGLQIQTKDGDWITAAQSPNGFIVMAGDCFHAWTNGRVHAPSHRVMMTGDEDRYSIGVFSSPKSGCIIKAPEEMVDVEHPLLFKPYNYTECFTFLYSHVSHGSTKSTLKDYCGV